MGSGAAGVGGGEPVGRRRGSRWASEDADGGAMEEHERKTMREVSDKVGPTQQG